MIAILFTMLSIAFVIVLFVSVLTFLTTITIKLCEINNILGMGFLILGGSALLTILVLSIRAIQ